MDLNVVYTIIVTCALANPGSMMGSEIAKQDAKFEYALSNDNIKKKKKKKKKLSEKGKKKKKGFFSKVFGSK